MCEDFESIEILLSDSTDPYTNLYIGRYFLDEENEKYDVSKALAYFKEASVLNEAKKHLLHISPGLYGSEYENPSDFFNYALQLSEKDDSATSTFISANCLLNGYGTKQSIQDAYGYYLEAKSRGIKVSDIMSAIKIAFLNEKIAYDEYRILETYFKSTLC